ncbi:MAG: cellulase family glycosylhydrolase [Acidimicrobiales bacterium]
MPDKGNWVGVNFWSRVGGPRMWTNYDRDVVREELATMAAHGCTVTRSFCYWPDFVPTVETLDEQVMANFADFLDAHVELGLGTIPTFIVGHMSGENWDPSWREGRDLYSDVWMVSQQAWFAETLTRRYAQHEAVVGWLISNEMPIYGGPASVNEITSWARIMVQAVRAGGGTQPVSLGDGAWGIEVTGTDNGYSLRALSSLVDFHGPHSYPMSDDVVRQSLAAAFVCEMSGTFDRPVVLEEFGLTSDFVSDENGAHYYRQVLYSSLLAGATGWIAWNNCDYDDLRAQDPYRHHPFELHFGLTDAKGKPKPQLHEVAGFSKFINELRESGWETVAGDVAIVVPEHFERVLPFTTDDSRQDIRDNLAQAYVAAREADLPVSMVREFDGLGDEAKLILLPSTKLLMAPTADRLVELAEAGATVYLSFFAGSTRTQRGPWIPWLNELFGLRQSLQYGLVNPIEVNEVVLTFVEDLGDLTVGDALTFKVAGNESSRSFLPVEAAGADVLATDQDGRPALLRRRVGKGSMIFCTYPLEYMAAKTARVNPEDTWRLYAALSLEAGVDRVISIADPRVMVGRLVVGDHERAVVVNLSDSQVVAELATTGATYADEPSGDAVSEITLAPFGVHVLFQSGGR